MSSEITGDLNQVIASAVQARIESEVAAALSGSDLMMQYVSAALHQKIEVKEGYSGRRQTTFLKETIDHAIQGAVKAAVQRVILEEAPAIEAAVATEVRKGAKDIAKQLVTNVTDTAASAYGLSVTIKYPSNDR